MAFAGKVVAITGGASGIGLATAQLLASKGAKLALADAREDALRDVQQQMAAPGTEVDCTAVDVRSRAQVEAWAKKVKQKFGKVDGLAICAGVAGKQLNDALIQDIDDDDWDFVLAVNLKGVLNTLRAFIADLDHGASIITIASLAGITGIAKDGAYVASKHAVVGLSRTAAIELGPRGIRVNCICPGPIDTPIIADVPPKGMDLYRQFSALRRIGKADEVAGLIHWLLSDASSFVTGTTQVIDGGFHNQ